MGICQKAFVGLALTLLAACHRTPSGQVAATVDGDEITIAELRMEMADMAASAQGQGAVLQQLIGRKLLYEEAERQHLADTPAAVAARARAGDAALVQLLASKLAGEARVDESQAAIDKFITDHPAQFAQRRLISTEQLIVSGGDAGLLARISALKTMPAIEALLAQANAPYIRMQTMADTAAMVPAVAAKITGLSPDQVFVAPSPSGEIQVSRIVSSRVEPLAGDQARTAARAMLGQARADAARARLRAIVEQGQKQVWIDPSLGKT